MKKIFCFLLAALLPLSFCGCVGVDNRTNVVKIGVLLPLSGQNAIFGQSGKNAITMLRDEINKSGGINGKKVDFMFADDQGSPSASVSAAQKLITLKNVSAIVGPLTSTCANSVAPIAQHYKIPMVTGTATSEKITTSGDYIFRTCFLDSFMGTMSAKFAVNDLKAKTAAVIYNNGDDYSNGLASNFIKAFTGFGGTVIDTEIYNTGDKDFNAQLTKISAKNPDVILMPDYYATVSIIANQARAIGIRSVFLGGDGWQSADLFKIGGKAVEGAYFTTHFSPDDTDPTVKSFVADFTSRFKTTPDAMAALNYDAAKVLTLAIKEAESTDPEKIKDALKTFSGAVVSGHIMFDENRNAIKSVVIVKTENAKEHFFERIDP